MAKSMMDNIITSADNKVLYSTMWDDCKKRVNDFELASTTTMSESFTIAQNGDLEISILANKIIIDELIIKNNRWNFLYNTHKKAS